MVVLAIIHNKFRAKIKSKMCGLMTKIYKIMNTTNLVINSYNKNKKKNNKVMIINKINKKIEKEELRLIDLILNSNNKGKIKFIQEKYKVNSHLTKIAIRMMMIRLHFRVIIKQCL